MTHQTAYNEFIADFVDRHGNNQATRDEAHEWADRIVEMARDVNRVVALHMPNSSVAKDAAADFIAALIYDMGIDNKEEARYIAACVK